MHRWTVDGRCPCGGTLEDRLVEVRMTAPDGSPVVLTSVPQAACPTCGSRYYHAGMLQRIEAVMEQTRRSDAK